FGVLGDALSVPVPKRELVARFRAAPVALALKVFWAVIRATGSGNQQQQDGNLGHCSRLRAQGQPWGQGLSHRTVWPPFITKRTRSSSATSFSGSPATAMMSA